MQPKKVLVVDDSKLIHKMFEVMLRTYCPGCTRWTEERVSSVFTNTRTSISSCWI